MNSSSVASKHGGGGGGGGGGETPTWISPREGATTASMASTMASSSGSRSSRNSSTPTSSSSPLTTTTMTSTSSNSNSSSNNISPVSMPFSEGRTSDDDDDDTDSNDAPTPSPSSAQQQISPDLSFPWRLHMLLNEASSSSSSSSSVIDNTGDGDKSAANSIFQWTDHGTAFEVLQQAGEQQWGEESYLLKKYFGGGTGTTSIKYNSFRKQLANYGFVPIPTTNCRQTKKKKKNKNKSKKFMHPDFSRDHPEHCHRIQRVRRKEKKMVRTDDCKYNTTIVVPDVPAPSAAAAATTDDFEPIPLREILRTAFRIEMPTTTTTTFVQWPSFRAPAVQLPPPLSSSQEEEEQYRPADHQYGNPQHPRCNNLTAALSTNRTNFGNNANCCNTPSTTATTNASSSSSMSWTTTVNPSSSSTTSVSSPSALTTTSPPLHPGPSDITMLAAIQNVQRHEMPPVVLQQQPHPSQEVFDSLDLEPRSIEEMQLQPTSCSRSNLLYDWVPLLSNTQQMVVEYSMPFSLTIFFYLCHATPMAVVLGTILSAFHTLEVLATNFVGVDGYFDPTTTLKVKSLLKKPSDKAASVTYNKVAFNARRFFSSMTQCLLPTIRPVLNPVEHLLIDNLWMQCLLSLMLWFPPDLFGGPNAVPLAIGFFMGVPMNITLSLKTHLERQRLWVAQLLPKKTILTGTSIATVLLQQQQQQQQQQWRQQQQDADMDHLIRDTWVCYIVAAMFLYQATRNATSTEMGVECGDMYLTMALFYVNVLPYIVGRRYMKIWEAVLLHKTCATTSNGSQPLAITAKLSPPSNDKIKTT